MINLITGLPGAAKTLYTLTIVDAISKADNRPVFYSGIAEVTLPGWTEIEAEDWFNCPPNSIIVIDECQRIFRPRTISKDIPKFVSELETHRHNGLDLYMITQHPMLADSALRRLAGRHLHVVRKFGMQSSTVHEWPGVKDTCDKPASRVDSIKHMWSFNKKMFGSYKSAEVHTVKRSLPMRVKLLALLPVVLGALGYFGYQSIQKKIHPVQAASSLVQASPGKPANDALPGKSVQAESAKGSYKNSIDDAKQYAYSQTPRVIGLAMSSPKYDEVTKPTAAPVPAACIVSATRCQCYSQQATKLQVTKAMCTQIAYEGYFQDFQNKEPESRVVSSSAVMLPPPSPSLSKS